MAEPTLYQLATDHISGGRYWPAELIARKMLATDAGDPRAWMIRAQCRDRSGDRAGAVAACRPAAQCDGVRPDVLLDLGSLHAGFGLRAEADAIYARLLETVPESLPALVNRGNVQLGLGNAGAAVRLQRQAISLRPDLPEAHYNLASALFHSGEIEQAFDAYEWRWKVGAFTTRAPDFRQPRWQKGKPEGDSLLIIPEQGLGDSIHFIRFVRLVKPLFSQVSVEVPRPLMRLFRSVPGIDRLVPYGGPYPDFDCWAPLLSLPHLLGLTRDSYPKPPYLPVSQDRRRRGTVTDGLRVGFSWTGNPQSRNNHLRSSTFGDFLPLLRRPDIRPVNLQKDVPPGQFDHPGLAGRIDDPMPGVKDFADTAEIINGLDLVVTVDNVIAHLAGAMGVPVLVLLPTLPDWRWGLGGDETFWYPSLRLFREDRQQGWQPAFAAVDQAVTAFIRGTG
ncbi:MAG: tetratricopeptide repeat-containing glycosyltransferase family protein [Rhodospirillales bacterium]